MSDHYRHHRASRDVQIVLVPVAFEGGSPKQAREVKPGHYPHQQREPWRPQRAIPASRKTEGFKRTVDLLRDLARREADARAMLRPNAALLRP
jgi:hypothetical protein